jgi:hypothetical protein
MADRASHRRSLAPLPALGSLHLLPLSMFHSRRQWKALSGGHTGNYLLATKNKPLPTSTYRSSGVVLTPYQETGSAPCLR